MLREAGHDVDEALQGASDLQLLERAATEDRILVTFDREFGWLALRQRTSPPAAVVVLRFAPAAPNDAGLAVQAPLMRADITLSGRLTIADRRRIRQLDLRRK